MEYQDYSSQPLRLTYSLFSQTMMESIQSYQRRLCYTDVQLVCEGGVVSAHSIVLAGASNFLKGLLVGNPDPVMVIHLAGVEYEPLKLLLEVLYGGEELQLTLRQVVALQDLGSLLHIDMCNSAAMEQAFLQASHEGVLSIPAGSLQSDEHAVMYSNESSPAPTPQPPSSQESPARRIPARSAISPGKPVLNNNNNNNTPMPMGAGKKRKSVSNQQNNSPMAPFSLLANVAAPASQNRGGGGGTVKRSLNEESEERDDPPVQPPKKLSRAALKEMVTCRECHTPFKLIMQLNQHMTREGHLFPPCPECAIPHDTLESLISHVDAHPPETIFTCKYCQKGVLSFDRYLYHMLMCKSLIRGDYVCFICRKSFRNSGSLKTHLLLHTGAKPFPCNYCSASFRQRHHRSHHERSVHLMQGLGANADQADVMADADLPVAGTPQGSTDGSRPFPCGFCNAAFRQSNHRSYHERVIHGVDRRTRQPKGGPGAAAVTIPRQNVAIATSKNGSNGGARKSINRTSVLGNGFTEPSEGAEDEIEDDDIEEDAEEGDLVEEDDIEEDSEMVDEEMVEAEVEADDDEEADDEQVEGEDDDEEGVGEEEDNNEEVEEDEDEANDIATSPAKANSEDEDS